MAILKSIKSLKAGSSKACSDSYIGVAFIVSKGPKEPEGLPYIFFPWV